jgi:hypothetical protein
VTISSTSQINTQAVCSGSLVGNITSYSLPSDVYIHSPVITSFFNFLVLGQGASVQTSIILKNSVSTPTKWYGICVSLSGDIKDCGYLSGSTPITCACD